MARFTTTVLAPLPSAIATSWNGGELLVCPVCFTTRKLDEGAIVANARIGGATPLWDWIGDTPATFFSY